MLGISELTLQDVGIPQENEASPQNIKRNLILNPSPYDQHPHRRRLHATVTHTSRMRELLSISANKQQEMQQH